MGLVSFFKEAGEKLFGKGEEAPAAAPVADPAAAQARLNEANERAAAAITKYIGANGLSADALQVSYDGTSSTVAP